MVNVDINTLS